MVWPFTSGSKTKTKISRDIENKVVNQSTLNQLNQITSQTTYNATIKSGQSCNQSTDCYQEVDYTNIKSKGKVIIHTGQTGSVTVSYDCLQQSNTVLSISNSISSKLYDAIANNVDQKTLDILNSYVKQKAGTGWASMPWSSSSTDYQQNDVVKNVVDNNTTVNLKNLITIRTAFNIATSNFTTSLQKTMCSQIAKYKNITGEAGVDIDTFQTDTVKSVSSTIQDTNLSINLTNSLADDVGLNINNDTKADNKASDKDIVDQEAETRGIDDVINAILGPLNNLIKELGEFAVVGGVGLVSSSLLISCCCLLMIIIIIYMMSK